MPRIITADVFKLRYDLGGYKLSYGPLTDMFPVLLKLTDSDGNVGWGEANPQQPFTEEDADEVIQVLKDELLPILLAEQDCEPAEIDGLLDKVRPEKHLLAKGAVSIALLDIKGKRLGVPVANLLGQVIRTSLPVSHPLNNGTAEDDIAVVDAKLKEGYVDFMLKMGAPSSTIADEIKRVAILDERYGKSVRFKADANTGWTREQAAEFLAGVENSLLAFVEEPIAKGDIDGMAELQKNTSLLISADESLTGMASAKRIIEQRAAMVFSIKITKNGGPLRAQALANLAKDNGILCYANSMGEGGITQAASLHLAVTTSNLIDIGHSFRSVLRLTGDVTNFASFIKNGIVYLPEGPGLGIIVDEDKVRQNALVSHHLARD
ncbi:enolase C-terminal domain-like protein [Sphingomonas crocodyli]|uniref:Mandelate racemase n=1 Tax=Sphingomonas crocodyli TaxID=1979270 RepID=A0A437M7P8_9SPHN|nr:enolase C-terminal domain-like protein [Sphingomonas crocodyli]RVT93524.1 mandelate racemase [Sphingomonas crocodyli]